MLSHVLKRSGLVVQIRQVDNKLLSCLHTKNAFLPPHDLILDMPVLFIANNQLLLIAVSASKHLKTYSELALQHISACVFDNKEST